MKAVLFDLYETLITESRTRPPGVSSLAPALGCERDAFRRHWKAIRPAVTIGRLSFRQALSDITIRLGRTADDFTLQRLCEERVRTKAEAFEHIDDDLLALIDFLRSRGIRLGVISNCCAEDIAAWPASPFAPRFDSTIFSFEVGLAKPDPEIFREAGRRLQVDVSDIWFVGDGQDDELAGAAQAGLRPFRATWFLARWPHFREEAGAYAVLSSVGDFVNVVTGAIGPPGVLPRRT